MSELREKVARVLFEAQGGVGFIPNDSWGQVADRILDIPEIREALETERLVKKYHSR